MTSLHDAGGIDSLHGNAVPANVRESDLILARVQRRGESAEFQAVRVWRLSPLGVELVQPTDGSPEFGSGERLDLQLVIEGRRSEFTGLVVSEAIEGSKEKLFGVRFLSEDVEQRPTSIDDRRVMRWVCSEEHLPRAVAPAPGRFNEFIGFQVKNISADGLMMVTDIENSFLIPKMTLRLSLNLPMVGDTSIECIIAWTRIGTDGAKDYVEVGARMIDLSKTSRAILGQYLVQFSRDASLEDLIEKGFSPNNLDQGISFYCLKTEKDYNEVLELRRLNSEDDGKPIETFVTEADVISRIVVGRIGSRIVAAARVKYPGLQENLSCEATLTWQKTYPRPDQIIEVEGIEMNCPDSMREPTLLALFRFICTACTSVNRPNVLVYTDVKPELFERVGWTSLGKTDSQYSVLIGNAYESIKGRNTNPIMWNYVWRRSARFLMESGVLRPVGTEKLMLRIYFAFGPASKMFFRLRRVIGRLK